MKKLQNLVAVSLLTIALVGFVACKSKPKDADLKASIETALRADASAAGTSVTVLDGVATLTGECKDNACVAQCEAAAKSVKGVKEVVNKLTVAPPPPPPAPVINPEDEVLTRALADALKDIPGVTSSVKDGKIVLTGEITKVKWTGLKQMLDKLKSKGYDLTGLKIK